jgi:hypothetical protein
MQFLLGVSHESVAETINFANWFTGTMCLELWVSVKRRGRGGDGVTKLHIFFKVKKLILNQALSFISLSMFAYTHTPIQIYIMVEGPFSGTYAASFKKV